jgi:Caspase domain
MTPQKRALLVGSPYKGLDGPKNDVDIMARVLGAQGFQIIRCLGQAATRDGIRKCWEELIVNTTDPSDTVVIYYSGHGGLLESPQNVDVGARGPASKISGQYQFIVPADFDLTTADDFRGLLDVEISHLLRDITKNTHNVTIILDCCHAGRMARDPSYGDEARPRNIEVQQRDISEQVRRLRRDDQFQGEAHLEGNPHVVRIAASATTESAWEYKNSQGEWVGAMTEALARALEEAAGHEVTWRTTLLRVAEMVNLQFPQQHPRVEGPDTRVHFSLRQLVRGAHPIRMEGDAVVIQAGRVAGIRDDSIYAVMPFGSEKPDPGSQIAEAVVISINGFRAFVELNYTGSAESIPKEGALAFPVYEAFYRWPVAFPDELLKLGEAIENSKYLRHRDIDEDVDALAEFRLANHEISLVNHHGVQLASQGWNGDETDTVSMMKMVRSAEQLARAQHLLSLSCETPEEALDHNLDLQLALVGDGKPGRRVHNDGADHINEGDRVCLILQNNGDSTVYVSVFNINVAGKISLVSNSNPHGIRLVPGSSYTIGKEQFSDSHRGLGMRWPNGVPKTHPVEERLVCILSNLEVDLRHLNSEQRLSAGRSGQSKLEMLTYGIAFGDGRDATCDSLDSGLEYDILHFSFLLCPNGTV